MEFKLYSILYISIWLQLESNVQCDRLYLNLDPDLGKEQSEHSRNVVLNCTATLAPFDNGAEFIVDGLSKDFIAIVENICINKYKKQCNVDECACNQSLNEFIVNITMDDLNDGHIFGCRMRFLNESTGEIINILIFRIYDGTVFGPVQYNNTIAEKGMYIVNKTINEPTLTEQHINVRLVLITVSVVGLFLVAIAVICGFRKHQYTKMKHNKAKRSYISTVKDKRNSKLPLTNLN